MLDELQTLIEDLRRLGLRAGDTVMVHSSYKALGVSSPETVIQALLTVLDEGGTLLMPALSYEQNPPHVHNTLTTSSCVGYLAEYFRQRPGTRRSLHPTHSACAVGARTGQMLDDHLEDRTPCGQHSPFNKILHCGGKILMLGCGLQPNTTMHAIEEYVRPPYLFGPPLRYLLTDANGRTFEKEYITHDFTNTIQRYDRVAQVLSDPQLVVGQVAQARAYLIEAQALFERALARLQTDPFYFVDRV